MLVRRRRSWPLPAERRVSGESKQEEDEGQDEGHRNDRQMGKGAPPARLAQHPLESFTPGLPALGRRTAAKADQPLMQLSGWDHHAHGIA